MQTAVKTVGLWVEAMAFLMAVEKVASMVLKKVVQMELHSVVDWDYVSVESLA